MFLGMGHLAVQISAIKPVDVHPDSGERDCAAGRSAITEENHTRPIAFLIGSGIALIVAVAFGIAITIINLRESALTDSKRELGNTALLIAKHVEQQIEELELVQNGIVEQIQSLGVVSNEDLERKMSGEEVQLQFIHRISGFSHINTLVLIDSDGMMVNASSGRQNPRISFADRDYFKALKSDPKLTVYFSEPVHGRIDAGWKIIVAHKISAPSGEFLGLIVASIRPEVFESYFQSISLGASSVINLQRNDGMLLVRYPHIESVVGRTYSGVLRALEGRERGTTQLVGKMENKDLILAGHRLRRYPIFVSVGMESVFALANWRKNTFALIGVGGFAVLLIAAIVYIITRKLLQSRNQFKRAFDEQQQQLDTAFRYMSQGLVMFDASGRLVVCNDRYRQIYDLPADLTKQGCSVLELLNYRVKDGTFKQSPEEYINNLFVKIAQGKIVKQEVEIGDGRIIAVVNQPMTGGGWVATHEDVTEKVRAEKVNEKQKLQLDAALENMSQGLCMFDATQRLIVCNKRYAELYGLDYEQTKPGRTLREILEYRIARGTAPHDKESYIRDRINEVVANRPYQITNKLGDGRFVSVVHQPMDGGGWVATHEDITVQKSAEQELNETKQFLNLIIENIPVAVVVKDAKTRKFVLVNRAFEAMLDLPQEDLLGRTVFDLYKANDAKLMDESDRECLDGSLAVRSNEYEVETPMRGSRILTTNRIVIRDTQGDQKYLVVVIDDVTDRRKSEQRIEFMAHHDALTGLVNRPAVVQKIEDAAARQRRRGEAFSVLLLDLDRFKQVNDTLGHPTGDALLREIAIRLKTLLRETDVLARLGGDEFVVIQSGERNQREAASVLSHRILDIVAQPFSLGASEVNIGASIGIALAPEHATNPDDLLKMADMALYRTKSGGRNGYSFYDTEMSEAANTRHEIESELRHAIQNNEFELHYQPIVNTKTRRICGAEALIRWRHPIKGMIAPDRFIPLAEETGLITQIGEWVLHTACTEAVTWPVDIKIAVNLSPVQFRKSNLPEIVMYALAQTGLSPERLELEITETALIESAAECLPVLQQFKNLGISVALDDFGTGYSSLGQLTMFPFDKIKIDKSFTQNMTKRPECAAIIAGTLTIAQGLGIVTTAEGVETADQYRLLRLAGVDSLQGYLFKRPGPASEIDFESVCGIPELENAA
jgi:diguanylate cyclase (GGDEF)-like protein/PAS domain S-box-containing protein